MPKKMDLSKFKNKIAHPSKKEDKFDIADRVLGTIDREKVIKRSIAVLSEDQERLNAIRKILLKETIEVSESHIFRLGLLLISNLSKEQLLDVIDKIPKVPTGRPRKS